MTAEPPLPSFQSLAMFHLHMLARATERFNEAYYKREFGLKLAECRVIGITASHGTVPFKRLCEEGDFEKSYASRLIQTLQDQGLVHKILNPADQRSISVALTSKGRATHHVLLNAATELNRRWLTALPPEEHQPLLGNLKILIAKIRQMTESVYGDEGEDGIAETRTPPVRHAEPEVVLDLRIARQLHDLLESALREKDDDQ